MAVNKNFVVKHGLEVANDLILATEISGKVGIASTVPSATFGVGGGVAAVDGLFVGILTAQGGLDVGVGGTSLSVDTNTGYVGINTGDPSYQLDIVGTGGTSLFITNGSINATSAIIGENTTINSDGVNVSGSVTATNFYGDGANLTGIATQFKSTVGIESGGVIIGAATTLNFIGAGNTFALNGTTVDISIQGGGGGGVGTAIDYPSTQPSPFSYIDGSVTVDENITFDDTNAGLGSSFIIVQEPELLIDPGSTVTVGAGKTLVTDLFMLNNRPDLNPNLRLTTLSVTGITTLGNVNAGVITCTDLNSTSDLSLKDNIEIIQDSSQILNEIKGVRFTWKELNKKSAGVIAQDVERAIPELVSYRADSGTKTVNYNGLIGVLIEAVKELSSRVDHLESQLNNK